VKIIVIRSHIDTCFRSGIESSYFYTTLGKHIQVYLVILYSEFESKSMQINNLHVDLFQLISYLLHTCFCNIVDLMVLYSSSAKH